MFSLIFLNLNSSFNIKSRLLKFSMVIIDIMMQGTVSQILYLGPSSETRFPRNGYEE